MARDGLRRDEIDLDTTSGLFFLAVEMTLCAVALQAPNRARMTRLCIEVCGLLDGQGVVSLSKGRDRSRQVVIGRVVMDKAVAHARSVSGVNDVQQCYPHVIW